jgi:ubiquinone/menaquinone biosynthesis C-methylase UbiE
MESLREKLFKFYYRVEAILTPGLRNAQFAYFDVLKQKLGPETQWLDIGCGRRLFPDWMPRWEEEQSSLRDRLKGIYGLDPDFSSLRDNHFVRFPVSGDSSTLPFANASFDLLTANMVVEHVAKPEALLAETLRVLKPNGVFIFHTPNTLSYATLLARLVPEGLKARLVGFFEGRKEEDVFPTLYLMNTPAKIEQLSREAGLYLAELMRVESSAQTVMLGPLVVLELSWIRILRLSALRNFRSNLIVILRKPA